MTDHACVRAEDIVRLQEREKALDKAFDTSLSENREFHEKQGEKLEKILELMISLTAQGVKIENLKEGHARQGEQIKELFKRVNAVETQPGQDARAALSGWKVLIISGAVSLTIMLVQFTLNQSSSNTTAAAKPAKGAR